jgi:hypothetical protein
MLTGAIALTLLVAVCPARGDRELHTHDSPAIAGNEAGISSERRIQVYLPPDYAGGTERYPTVYYLPGWGGGASLGNSSVDALDAAIESGELPPVIVVGVSGSVRPAAGMIFLSSTQFGDWEGYLIDELIPWVDSTYRTVPDWLRRALTGWSAGGYAAMLLPVLHPGVWGASGANDPASPWGCTRNTVPDGAFLDVLPTQGMVQQVAMQIGTRLAPNPNEPIGYDQPLDVRDATDFAIWDEWRSTFCLKNSIAIENHSDALRALSVVAVVMPLNTSGTFTSHSNVMLDAMTAVGTAVTRLDMPGDHFTDASGRFLTITQEVVAAMNATEIPEPATSVRAGGKLATTWATVL